MWQFWAVIAGLTFIGEIITTGFLLFWFSLGAILAMIVSFFTDNIIIQTIVFILSSSLLILFTRKFANKFSSKDTMPTNAFSILHKKGIVTKGINSKLGTGEIKVGSEIWSAKSDEDISVDSKVEILKIDGVKAIVKKI